MKQAEAAFVLHPPAFIYFVERETRFELATLALARRCSTTELLPLSKKTNNAVLKVVERNVPLFLPLSQIGWKRVCDIFVGSRASAGSSHFPELLPATA